MSSKERKEILNEILQLLSEQERSLKEGHKELQAEYDGRAKRINDLLSEVEKTS